MDMEGHGHSPGIRGVPDVEKAVHDHVEMRHAAEKEGLPIFLLGHSLGGLVSAGSVVAEPTNVKGVILTSPALPKTYGMLVELAVGAVAALVPGLPLPLPKAPMDGLSRIPGVWEEAVADEMCVQKQLGFRIASTSLKVSRKIGENFAVWKDVPVLIMHGSADTWTDPKDSKYFFDSIASEDKKLEMFEGGRHEILNDLDQDAALKLILDWLVEHVQ